MLVRPRWCRSSATSETGGHARRGSLPEGRTIPLRRGLSGYMRRCVIATRPSKKSKPSTPATEPKPIVDELRDLVRASEADRSVWHALDRIRKIAVALVLRDNSPYLKKLGVETFCSLKVQMDSARPLIGSEWCAAVMTVRYNRWLRQLKDAVEQVERGKFTPRFRGTVEAFVFAPDNDFEFLGDDGLKEAIKSLRESRAKWAEFYDRWGVTKPLQWQVTAILDFINDDFPASFNAVEKAARSKVWNEQFQLAKQLRETRNKLLQITTCEFKGAGSEIAQACRLMGSISSKLQCEGETYKELAQRYELQQFRGGRNNQRMAVIKALAPIYTDLTGRPAGAGWNPIQQDHQTEFVRFVHDFIETAGRPDWAEGLEFAVHRCLREVRSKKA